MINNTDKQKGVSLIITFFIMIIILAVVMSVSALLYSEIKVIGNVKNSMAGLFAADSGIEKTLFYDRQVLLSGASRGLCSIPTKCLASGLGDQSIYCSSAVASGSDCSSGPNGCTNCTVTYNTVFDNRRYEVIAKVYPSGLSSNFEISSKGIFEGAQRQIKILIVTTP